MGLAFATPRSCDNPRMTFAPEPVVSGCFAVEFGPLRDTLLLAGLVAIPVVAIPVIARVARRYPSRELQIGGRRQWGVRLRRWGLVTSAR